jgi:hypothetical protein
MPNIPNLPCRGSLRGAHIFSLRLCSRLRRFPVCLVQLNLPPVRHVAAVAAVELLGNAVVTSWAPIPSSFPAFIVSPSLSNLFSYYPQSSL